MDVERVLMLADYIEDSKTYEQSLYTVTEFDPVRRRWYTFPADIAGHAAFLSGVQDMYGGDSEIESIQAVRLTLGCVWEKASYWLDLNFDQRALFWSSPPCNPQPTSKDAAAVLRHLAETGEVDWRVRAN